MASSTSTVSLSLSRSLGCQLIASWLCQSLVALNIALAFQHIYRSRKDRWPIHLMVGFLTLASAWHAGLLCHATWYYAIQSHPISSLPLGLQVPITSVTAHGVGAVIAVVAQLFYVLRAEALSPRRGAVIIGFAPLLITELAFPIYAIAKAAAIPSTEYETIRWAISAWITMQCAVNVLLIIVTISFLVRKHRSSSNQGNILREREGLIIFDVNLLPLVLSIAAVALYWGLRETLEAYDAVLHVNAQVYVASVLVTKTCMLKDSIDHQVTRTTNADTVTLVTQPRVSHSQVSLWQSDANFVDMNTSRRPPKPAANPGHKKGLSSFGLKLPIFEKNATQQTGGKLQVSAPILHESSRDQIEQLGQRMLAVRKDREPTTATTGWNYEADLYSLYGRESRESYRSGVIGRM